VLLSAGAACGPSVGVGPERVKPSRRGRFEISNGSVLPLTAASIAVAARNAKQGSAWVIGLLPGNGRRAEIAAAALQMLAVTDGDEIEVRAVHSGALGG